MGHLSCLPISGTSAAETTVAGGNPSDDCSGRRRCDHSVDQVSQPRTPGLAMSSRCQGKVPERTHDRSRRERVYHHAIRRPGKTYHAGQRCRTISASAGSIRYPRASASHVMRSRRPTRRITLFGPATMPAKAVPVRLPYRAARSAFSSKASSRVDSSATSRRSRRLSAPRMALSTSPSWRRRRSAWSAAVVTASPD